MKDGEQNKPGGDETPDPDKVTQISEAKKDEPTQTLDPNAPPTHIAIDARVCADILKFLGKFPHKKVRAMVAGIEGGAGLVLGPKAK